MRGIYKLLLIIVILLYLLSGSVTAINGSEINDTGSDINNLVDASFENESIAASNFTELSESSETIVQQGVLMSLEAAHAPQTFTVGPSGCDYTHINDAIVNATDGDTIIVMSGSYPETIVVDKSLTILGNDTGSGIPVISYQESGYVPVTIDSESVTFDNFRILSTGDSAISVLRNNSIVRNITAIEQKPDDSDTPVINISEDLAYITVSDCRIETEGKYGIYFRNANHILTDNNTITLKNLSGSFSIMGEYSGNNITFSDIVVRDNLIDGGRIDIGAARYAPASHPVIKDILVDNNAITNSNDGGIEVTGHPFVTGDQEYIYSNTNVTVTNNTVSQWETTYGILVDWATGGLISGNTVNGGFGGYEGLGLEYSKDFEVRDNVVENCTGGLQIVGMALNEVKNTVVTGNTLTNNQMNFAFTPGTETLPDMVIDTTNKADGRSIYYYEEEKDLTVDASIDPATLMIVSCENVLVEGISPSENNLGLAIFNTTGAEIRDCNINNNYNGLLLSMSSNCVVSNNTVEDIGYNGISVYDTSDSIITNNVINKTTYSAAVYFYSTSNNVTVAENEVRASKFGFIFGSFNSERPVDIVNNTVSNGDIGVYMEGTLGDHYVEIRSNNFTNMTGSSFYFLVSKSCVIENNTAINLAPSDVDIYSVIMVDSVSVLNKTIYAGGDHQITNNFFNSPSQIYIGDTPPTGSSPVNITETRWLWGGPFDLPSLSEEDVEPSRWNITKTAGTNIVGGPYLGGNYWATPDGTGWSQTHSDRGDGFCSEPFAYNTNNTDYLPLHIHSNNTITVGPSGCNYTRINDAIGNATDGDTIIVMSGSYPETIVVDKSLTILGNNTGAGNPVIGDESADATVTVLGDGVTLQNFTFNNAQRWNVNISADNLVLRDLEMVKHDPVDKLDSVIYGEDTTGLTIENCNLSTEGKRGINLNDTRELTINNSIVNLDFGIIGIQTNYNSVDAQNQNIQITNNSLNNCSIYVTSNEASNLSDVAVCNNVIDAPDYSGIFISCTTKLTVEGNTIRNSAGVGGFYGISIIYGSNGTVKSNLIQDFYSGAGGIYLEDLEEFNISDNVVKDIVYYAPTQTIGLAVREVINSVITGNTLTNVEPYSFDYAPGSDMLPNLLFDETNTVDGKPVLYYEGESGVKVENRDPAMVVMMSCSNIEITNSTIKESMLGVGIYNSSGVLVTGNSINESYNGLMLIKSEDSVIKGNTFYEDLTGLGVGTNRNADISDNIFIDSLSSGIMVHSVTSDNVTISENRIYGTFNGGQGIALADALETGIRISDNYITGSTRGLSAHYASNFTIANNRIEDCGAGISLTGVKDNIFESNTIINSGEDYIGLYLYDNGSVRLGAGLCINNLLYDNYVESVYPLQYVTVPDYLGYGLCNYSGEFGAAWGPEINVSGSFMAAEGEVPSWNQWNITKTAGTNIVGGPYLGGNYWATPDGTGWSQTHSDRGDGFCSEPFACNTNNTDYLPLHTGAKPAANFTASPVSGYAPLTVSFTDFSTGNITGLEWNFGDGQTSAEENPVHVYSSAGSYSVTLTATGPGGSDAMVLTNYVIVTGRSSGGGSGGGSSGSSISVFSGSGSLITSSDGKVLKSVQVDADDGVGEIVIPKGTYALNEAGAPLSGVSITPEDGMSSDVSLPNGFSFAGYAYECTPSGATFSPAAELVFTFSDDEWAELMAGNEPLVLLYVGADGTTEEIPVVIDEAGRTVTAAVTHFSTYYLMYTESSGSQAEVTSVPTTVSGTPTSGLTQSPTTESSGFSAFVLLISVIALVFVGFYSRRRE